MKACAVLEVLNEALNNYLDNLRDDAAEGGEHGPWDNATANQVCVPQGRHENGYLRIEVGGEVWVATVKRLS